MLYMPFRLIGMDKLELYPTHILFYEIFGHSLHGATQVGGYSERSSGPTFIP